MEYIPTDYQSDPPQEVGIDCIYNIVESCIIRKVRIFYYTINGNALFLYSRQLNIPLKISCDNKMHFGTEFITAKEYLRRVLEKDDYIDVVAFPSDNEYIDIALFWIHIVYIGNRKQAGKFSKKDDGMFAMRTKSGEKAERIVTRNLIAEGHDFLPELSKSPGYFTIQYEGKRHRKPDRICLKCGITFEVKKRNKDQHIRVSHSETRSFESENKPDGWHAFVFPDMKPRYIPNKSIILAIENNEFRPGSDQYDSWADVDHLYPENPPKCIS